MLTLAVDLNSVVVRSWVADARRPGERSVGVGGAGSAGGRRRAVGAVRRALRTGDGS